MEQFQTLPLKGLDTAKLIRAARLNSLGSLFYFTKNTLRRQRLTRSLHYEICRGLESDRIKNVYELPRDHFKSTICSEALPMWWALPLSREDIGDFKALGYSDEFVRHMQRVHDPNTRTLLVSENITNSAKLGTKVRWHYESNAWYRTLFPETLPGAKEIWTNFSLHVRRSEGAGAAHGEGTFDFLGVGGALQSRHYNRVVQDDLVGRKAIESASIMDKTIDYHKLLVGAFESDDKTHENDELVVGNRWGFNDLNSHIREHEPWFVFSTHSAMGGCCALHPADQPIFPEEFSAAKLAKFKIRLGSYHYSCQFLNNPVSPEDADFREEWLNYYHMELLPDGRIKVVHESKYGTVRKDVILGHLNVFMAVDPNHAGNAAAGRCRHAIVVVGMSSDENFYLLDCCAMHASYDTFFNKIYEVADTWRLNKAGVETVAAQKYVKYHIEWRNKTEKKHLRIIELKGETEAPDGTVTRQKEWRIRNVLAPIFESGRFWTQRRFQDFFGEYSTFPRGKFVDILDALAYTPQMLKMPMTSQQFMDWQAFNRAQASQIGTPYSRAQVTN